MPVLLTTTFILNLSYSLCPPIRSVDVVFFTMDLCRIFVCILLILVVIFVKWIALQYLLLMREKHHADVAHMHSGDYFPPKIGRRLYMDGNQSGDRRKPLSFEWNFQLDWTGLKYWDWHVYLKHFFFWSGL